MSSESPLSISVVKYETVSLPLDLLYRIIFDFILDFSHCKLLGLSNPWNAIRSLAQVSSVFRKLTLRACSLIFNTNIETPERFPLDTVLRIIYTLCNMSPTPPIPQMASSVLLGMVDDRFLTVPPEKTFGMLQIYRALDYSETLRIGAMCGGWHNFHRISPMTMIELLGRLEDTCTKTLAICQKMNHRRMVSLSYQLVLDCCTANYFIVLFWNATNKINQISPEDRSTNTGLNALEEVLRPLEFQEGVLLQNFPPAVVLDGKGKKRTILSARVLLLSGILPRVEALRDGHLGIVSTRADNLLKSWYPLLGLGAGTVERLQGHHFY